MAEPKIYSYSLKEIYLNVKMKISEFFDIISPFYTKNYLENKIRKECAEPKSLENSIQSGQ